MPLSEEQEEKTRVRLTEGGLAAQWHSRAL